MRVMWIVFLCTSVLALRPENDYVHESAAPPVPRCMLADAKKGMRKKLKSASTNARNQASIAIKKCKDKPEAKCLEEAVHGNCKWCEGLCGPNEV
eukprot:Skav221830  [mRNA]  locus=scaffold885:294812:296851:+ [translate_table: standard]